MKALVGAFNQERALVGAFSVIVKTDCETDGALHSTSTLGFILAAQIKLDFSYEPRRMLVLGCSFLYNFKLLMSFSGYLILHSNRVEISYCVSTVSLLSMTWSWYLILSTDTRYYLDLDLHTYYPLCFQEAYRGVRPHHIRVSHLLLKRFSAS